MKISLTGVHQFKFYLHTLAENEVLAARTEVLGVFGRLQVVGGLELYSTGADSSQVQHGASPHTDVVRTHLLHTEQTIVIKSNVKNKSNQVIK